MKLFKKTFYILEGNFLSSKNKKNYSEIFFCNFGNGTSKKQNLLYFRMELAKLENQKISYISPKKVLLTFWDNC